MVCGVWCVVCGVWCVGCGWFEGSGLTHAIVTHTPTTHALKFQVWLHDVPDDRHLVLGNRVALNTGLLFLRGGRGGDGGGTARSLKLLDEWMGVSHLVQCHAFDQVCNTVNPKSRSEWKHVRKARP